MKPPIDDDCCQLTVQVIDGVKKTKLCNLPATDVLVFALKKGKGQDTETPVSLSGKSFCGYNLDTDFIEMDPNDIWRVWTIMAEILMVNAGLDQFRRSLCQGVAQIVANANSRLIKPVDENKIKVPKLELV